MSRKSAMQRGLVKVFDKGRRPRRHIKAAQARKGVRFLRAFLAATAVLGAGLSALSYYHALDGGRTLPAIDSRTTQATGIQGIRLDHSGQ